MNTKTPIIALLLAAMLVLAGCSTTTNTQQNQTNTTSDSNQSPIRVGGDVDAHGCKPSAGYTWCDALNQCIRPWETNCSTTSTPTDSAVTYISKNLETCKVVKYMCVQGKEPFTDENGCGCRPTTTAQPAAEVKSYVHLNNDTYQCKVINYMCLNGQQAFVDDKGCGCKTVSDTTQPAQPTTTEPEKTFCKPEQKNAQICTMEYHQVCGWFNESVKCLKYPCAIEAANPCGACANANVDYYTEGACPTMPPATTQEQTLPVQPKRVVMSCEQQYVDMQNNGTAACTREYMPVCATDAADGQNTYGNKCVACTTPGVFEYVQGACNDGTGAVV